MANKWYPSKDQLDSPDRLERSFRETLRQLYALQQQVSEIHAKAQAAPSPAPTNTAAVTRLLGLPVEPSDTTQLADGTVLTYVAAARKFQFK